MSARVLVVQSPHMRGKDVEEWQRTLNRVFNAWRVDYQVKVDGDYGVTTRDATATVLYGLGILHRAMVNGVTPALRSKVRNEKTDRTAKERERSRRRASWRAELRRKHQHRAVASPLVKILQHSWGYHPGVHDGVDLICSPNAVGHAICDARVLRADAGGWWGLGAPADPAVRAKGDGIVVLECLVDLGPFRKGLRFCYGHAEHPLVKPGDLVKAGQPICRAGLANAWHFHFMVNGRRDDRGVGDRDPWPFIAYAMKYG